MRVEHIGIAVKDLTTAIKAYEQLLGQAPSKIEHVESEGVATAFFNTANGTKIELLAPLRPDSAIARFLEKHGEGIHHIAFGVETLQSHIDRLSQAGFQVLYNPPRPGADGKMVTFIHPRDTHGVLVEFCADRPPEE